MGILRYRTTIFWVLLLLLGVAASLPLLLGSDQRSRLLALNTLWLAAGTCAIALPLGSCLAMLVVRTDMPGRTAAGFLLAMMLFVPLYLQTAAWQAGFGIGGWCSPISETPLLTGWRGAVWIHAMAATPWAALIVGVGLRLVPAELEELALLDGTPVQVFLHVTLRRAIPAVGVAALWILVSTAGEMTVSDAFQLRTYAEELYTGYALGSDLHEAPLTVLPGVIIIAWLVVAAILFCAHILPSDYRSAVRPPWVFRLGAWRWPATAVVAVLLILLIGLPLGNLIYKAGVLVRQIDGAPVRGWSAMHVLEIVSSSPGRYRSEFGWTLATGSLAATAAVCLAVPLAWWARRGGLRATPALFVTAVCLAVPGPLVGLAIVWLLSRPDMPALTFLRDRTIFAPLAAQLIRSLPLTLLILWQALRTIPAEMLDLAAIEGAGPVTRLWRVALPQRRAALAAAWLAAAAVAMGDVAATAADMVVPPSLDLLSRRLAGLLHASVNDYYAGICLVNGALFLLMGAAVLVVAVLSRNRLR